jgi:hypothetical protein
MSRISERTVCSANKAMTTVREFTFELALKVWRCNQVVERSRQECMGCNGCLQVLLEGQYPSLNLHSTRLEGVATFVVKDVGLGLASQ